MSKFSQREIINQVSYENTHHPHFPEKKRGVEQKYYQENCRATNSWLPWKIVLPLLIHRTRGGSRVEKKIIRRGNRKYLLQFVAQGGGVPEIGVASPELHPREDDLWHKPHPVLSLQPTRWIKFPHLKRWKDTKTIPFSITDRVQRH